MTHRNEAVPVGSERPSQRSTSVGKTVRRVKDVSGFCIRGEAAREQPRLGGATSEDISVLVEVRWPFVVDWRTARGWICVYNVDRSGRMGVVE